MSETSLTEPSGVGEPISPSPYSAKLLGWSDEELASSDFFRLVDAIRWLTDAEQNGAIARRAGIFSATGELVWARALHRTVSSARAIENSAKESMKYTTLCASWFRGRLSRMPLRHC